LPIPAILRPAPIRTRLWQAAGAIGVFLATILIGNAFVSRDRAVTAEMLGHDFLAFYAAGTFARSGEFDRMYDLSATRAFQQHVAQESGLDVRDAVAPYWNPPFFAWIFAPLSLLRFGIAVKIWIAMNLAALAGALILLRRMIPSSDWRTWALVPALIVLSMPFIQALSHGQNTSISLLLLAALVTAWRRRQDVAAGALCGLLFFKPQLAAVVAIILIVDRGLRVCLGLAFVLGSMCLITALTMQDALGDYMHRLPLNVIAMQIDNAYLWERHATLKAFWRLLFQGRAPGETSPLVAVLTILSCLLVTLGLIIAVIRDRRAPHDNAFTGETGSIRRDRLISAAITAMPLLMPFYFDYDLLLLAIPAALFAAELMMYAPGRSFDRDDKLLAGGFVAIYLWMMVNSGLGRLSGINLTVLLLSALTFLMIRRACRRIEPQQFGFRAPEVIRVTARRAA
jgi:hypothetical protein